MEALKAAEQLVRVLLVEADAIISHEHHPFSRSRELWVLTSISSRDLVPVYFTALEAD